MTRTYQLTDDQVATIRIALEELRNARYIELRMQGIDPDIREGGVDAALAALDTAGDGAATKIYVWIANEERTAALSELLGKVVRSSPEWTIGMSHIQKMIDAVEVIDVQDEQRP